MKAMWHGVVLAEASKEDVINLENNVYFPPAGVKTELLKINGEVYECPWKGHCDYYDVTVNGETNPGAAWMYPQPKEAAKQIAGYFAFWKGVEITE
jgi:uncharacterized protein (DUF427 family)